MALPDLTGNKIKDTYQRVVQTGDGKTFYNGTGSAIPIVTNPFTGSLAISGSIVLNGPINIGLNNLNDVTITSVQPSDLLVRNLANNDWENTSGPLGDYTWYGNQTFDQQTVHNTGILTKGNIEVDAHLVHSLGGEISPGRDYWFATASIGKIRTFQNSIEFCDESTKATSAVLSVDGPNFVIKNSVGAKTAISGANANFTNVVQAGSFIGPLTGTASWATNARTASFVATAQTASYVLNAVSSSFAATASFVRTAQTASYVLNAVSSSFATSASYALNGGVTQIIAGTNVTISPAGGTGAVTINSTGGGGGGSTFPYTGSAIISGSLIVTGSTFVSGGISTQYIDFDINVVPAFSTGRVNWVDDTKTIAIDTELNGFQIEVGHQNVIRVRNETGTTISRSRVVYLSGSSGNRPLIYTASYELDPTSAGTVGLVAADIGSSNNGYVISNGLIRDVNTTAFNAGAVLYLSSSGQLSTSAPVAPLHAVRLGKVITSAVSGIIHVDVDNGYEIGELHDVVDTSTNSSYGDLLVKSGSVWKSNRQLTGSYGLTGSLSVTSGGITSSLFGTASWATNALTASLALRNIITASVSSNTITFTKGDGTTFPITVNTGSGGGGGGVTINNNTNNYLVTATGTANTLDGEANLTFDGSLLDVIGDIQFNENRIRTSSTTVGQPGKGADLAYDWGNFTTAPTAGRIVYFASGSGGFGWRDTLANATGSSIGPLGVATNAASQDEILLRGTVRVSGSLSGLVAGQVVYLSNTVSGSVTGTAPSTSGHVVRILGYVISPTDNTMYFNPDFSYITRT
jgi:hypothetical protein